MQLLKEIPGSVRSSYLASHTTALIISNGEMENIMKIDKSLKNQD